MNGKYFLFLGIGVLLCTGLFVFRLGRRGLKPAVAAAALPLAILLGAVMAKGVYFLAKLPEQWDNYGLGGLMRTRPAEFSFVGGAIGVTLAVILAAKALRKPVWPVLDAFAPCGALLAAIVRACEGLLDPMSLVGLGDFVADEALHVFPLAVENAMLYSWFYAVFMLEAACALVVAAVGFILGGKSFAPGRVALQTAFFLALPQIFCERMLNQCTKWGFVRVEQLLCAVIVFAVIAYACAHGRGKSAWIPALLDFVCVGGIIWIEFTLDNKPPFGLELPTMVCYGLMIGFLACMAALDVWAYRRIGASRG